MKDSFLFLTVIAIVMMFIAPALLKAEDDKETISGKVQVTKNKTGQIKKIIIAQEGKDEDGDKEITIYSVTLDKNGLALAKYENKEVSIVGIVDDDEMTSGFALSLKVLKIKVPIDKKK